VGRRWRVADVRLHLAPQTGAVPLASLTTARIDALYRQLERGGRADHKAGEGLSPRTVRYIHTILSAALGAAEVARCRKALGDSAVPVIRLHDLRHTHATLLLLAGVPVHVVSERLGHASPVITMQVYAHVLPGSQREAAELFASLIERGKAQ
jgi:integrase